LRLGGVFPKTEIIEFYYPQLQHGEHLLMVQDDFEGLLETKEKIGRDQKRAISQIANVEEKSEEPYCCIVDSISRDN